MRTMALVTSLKGITRLRAPRYYYSALLKHLIDTKLRCLTVSGCKPSNGTVVEEQLFVV
jgi:hypothetical protein